MCEHFLTFNLTHTLSIISYEIKLCNICTKILTVYGSIKTKKFQLHALISSSSFQSITLECIFCSYLSSIPFPATIGFSIFFEAVTALPISDIHIISKTTHQDLSRGFKSPRYIDYSIPTRLLCYWDLQNTKRK